MDDLNQGLERILSNPQAMEQIMALASSLSAGTGTGETPQEQSAPKEAQEAPAGQGFPPGPDFISLISQAGMDKNQQNLLGALKPYLNGDKLHKLQRAMEAAKIAQLALGFMGNRGPGGG